MVFFLFVIFSLFVSHSNAKVLASYFNSLTNTSQIVAIDQSTRNASRADLNPICRFPGNATIQSFYNSLIVVDGQYALINAATNIFNQACLIVIDLRNCSVLQQTCLSPSVPWFPELLFFDSASRQVFVVGHQYSPTVAHGVWLWRNALNFSVQADTVPISTLAIGPYGQYGANCSLVGYGNVFAAMSTANMKIYLPFGCRLTGYFASEWYIMTLDARNGKVAAFVNVTAQAQNLFSVALHEPSNTLFAWYWGQNGRPALGKLDPATGQVQPIPLAPSAGAWPFVIGGPTVFSTSAAALLAASTISNNAHLETVDLASGSLLALDTGVNVNQFASVTII